MSANAMNVMRYPPDGKGHPWGTAATQKMALSTNRGPTCTAQQETTLVTKNTENMTSQASRPNMTGSESPTDPLSVRLLIHVAYQTYWLTYSRAERLQLN